MLSSRPSRAALREVKSTSGHQLDRKTAIAWLGRALACWQIYARTGDVKKRCEALLHGDEALEHAAKVGDGGKLVGEIESALRRAKMEAGRTPKGKRSRTGGHR